MGHLMWKFPVESGKNEFVYFKTEFLKIDLRMDSYQILVIYVIISNHLFCPLMSLVS
eukprot:XP_765809.1 hypothetical protein [Theileria parva strain Muguga]